MPVLLNIEEGEIYMKRTGLFLLLMAGIMGCNIVALMAQEKNADDKDATKELVTQDILHQLGDEQLKVQYYIDEEIILSTETSGSKVDNGTVIRNNRKVEEIQIPKGTPVVVKKVETLKFYTNDGKTVEESDCLRVCLSKDDDSGKILYFRPGSYKDRYGDGYYLIPYNGKSDEIQNKDGGEFYFDGKFYKVSVQTGNGTNWPYLLYDVREINEPPNTLTLEGQLVP
jgi:hypothetical protein